MVPSTGIGRGLLMNRKFLITAFAAAVIAGCGGEEAPAAKSQMDPAIVKSNVAEPFDFKLPSKVSGLITVEGKEKDLGAPINLDDDFKVEETHGKWQIWVAHNVWSDSRDVPTDYLDRTGSISTVLKAIMETKRQNNLDFELNFIQLDAIPSTIMAGGRISPAGNNHCGQFWALCVDRFVISPMVRHQTKGSYTLREWIPDILDPVIKDAKDNGLASKYEGLAYMGLLDDKSEYWDVIEMMAFIVNPDGEVVDALVPAAGTSGVSPNMVMSHFMLAAGIDADDVKVPEANPRTYFKPDMMFANAAHTKFGGDYISNAVSSMAEMLEK
jgi:hypothetical protein